MLLTVRSDDWMRVTRVSLYPVAIGVESDSLQGLRIESHRRWSTNRLFCIVFRMAHRVFCVHNGSVSLTEQEWTQAYRERLPTCRPIDWRTDRPTDEPTDRWTDRPTRRTD
jgi:hypothetical protein